MRRGSWVVLWVPFPPTFLPLPQARRQGTLRTSGVQRAEAVALQPTLRPAMLTKPGVPGL